MLDEEDDNVADPIHPRLRLSTEEKKHLRGPWKKTLIIKLLEKTIGIKLLSEIVRKLWQLARDFEFLELGNGYLLAKFDNVHDCSGVLTEGPWLIFGHYLIVQP
ncbi:DUF4283 domain-containing protein [Cephalotus follicularis]|uniref:DUF4283 domain-containing protein n=1 Tax=Cephalotus follicularis TaxID=3775 RepID=A0A1Q3CQ81_CEPFO|nr:DUF4283 domain-containing protein [Cephalotus follicularis]